jgi:hypothetical protein
MHVKLLSSPQPKFQRGYAMMIVRIGRDGGTVEGALMVAVPEEK